jgi:hypothetical protein
MFLQRLMKTLLLFKIAGQAPTVIQLANATALDAGLGGERNYEYAKVLLERLRTRASFLAVERNDGGLQDRYSVDASSRVSELARRRIKNALQELQPNDARIAQYILSCCRDEPFPLATLSHNNDFTVVWRNATRLAGVGLLVSNSSQAFSNRAALLLQPGAREDFLLLIQPPFSIHNTQSTFDGLSPDERVRAAIVLWCPRRPTDDEVQFTREAAAIELLLSDPQLLDNRRGRAILDHLQNAAHLHRAQAAQLATRLLREGAVQSADGTALEAGELALGETWQSTLEAVAEFCLPRVYERFEAVAPRARVLTPSNADTLCLEILRRPASEPYFAAAHERIVRALCEPLGIARADKGRWKISTPRTDLKQEFTQFVSAENAVTFAQLDAHFSKSAWGLKSEQIALVVCALLRSGELTGLDARGQSLIATQIGMPLRRSLHALRAGALLGVEQWQQWQLVVSLLTNEKLGERCFEEQERTKVLLTAWKEEAAAQVELVTARIHQLQRALRHDAAQWQNAMKVVHEIDGLQKAINPHEITGVANLEVDYLRALLPSWRNLWAALERHHAPLLTAFGLLTNADLSVPPALAVERTALLQRFADGETIVRDEQLAQDAKIWSEKYLAEYREWHNAQHNRERWNSLRRMLHCDDFRALQALGELRSRAWPRAKEIEAAIHTELAKQCARDGTLLPGEATCNACRLRYGTKVLISDAQSFQAQIEQALASFASAIQEEAVRDFLSRHDAAQELLQWKNGAELLPLLNPAILELLEAAFKPRRCVQRSLQTLESTFRSCRTRGDFQLAFAQWLDGAEQLSNDDEVQLTQ